MNDREMSTAEWPTLQLLLKIITTKNQRRKTNVAQLPWRTKTTTTKKQFIKKGSEELKKIGFYEVYIEQHKLSWLG